MPIYTGSDVDSDRTLECDVCVVGSGAGGAHVAQRLATAGKRVIVLEEGSFHTSDTFDMTEERMNRLLYQEGAGRGTADRSIVVVQGRAVGGTTVVNWTTCFRTPKRVFEYWAEHHGVEGPSYEAFVPHWERIEKRLNVTRMSEREMNRNNRVTYDGARKLGWSWDFLERNIKRCAHTGYCGMGCPIDAKQSMLVTMIPEAVRAGADVYANAWVERVERDGRHVKEVVARLRDPKTERFTGHVLRVRARMTVLAGGGINTPAVLLRSDINGNGRTGHRTFLHPAVPGVGLHDERIEPFVGSPQYVGVHEFVDRGPDRIGMLIEGAPMFPMISAGYFHAFGEGLHEFMRQLPHMSMAAGLLHDGFDVDDPDEGGVVSLREGGLPKLDYKWTPRLVEGLRAATRNTMLLMLAGGAREAYSAHMFSARSPAQVDQVLADAPFGPCEIPVFSAHVMGGCAMGTDPARAVVDSRTLRHHELDDLFVIDGSVFPTSTTVNPQISIYGLASWASEHVLAAL